MAVLSDDVFQKRLKEKLTYCASGRLLEKDTQVDESWQHNKGYRRLYFESNVYLLHRLIFLYHKGYLPKVIDHIDGSTTNNRIENLQDCSQSVNISKSKLFNTNKTGYRGVHYNVNAKKYEAYFMRDYKKHYLGLFDDSELAALVVEEAKDQLTRINYLKGKYGTEV